MLKVSIRATLAALVLLVVAGCAGHPSDRTSASVRGASDAAVLTAADATREAGHYAEAREIYQRLLLDTSPPAGARYGAAECDLALGHPENALTLFNGLVPNAEFHARALQGRGLAQFALGQRDAAARSLREATAADTSLWRAWNGLGDLADLGRQTKEAAGYYGKALALHPNSAMIHNNIGYSLLTSGNFPAAAGEFRAALALEPDNVTVQTNLRLAQAASGDYEAALRSAPRDQLPDLLNDVGYIAMRRGDYAAARHYLGIAMDATGGNRTVAARNLDWLNDKDAPRQ